MLEPYKHLYGTIFFKSPRDLSKTLARNVKRI